MHDEHSSSLTVFLVDQDDGSTGGQGQQQSHTVNIPVETETSSADVSSAMVDQLRNCLKSLDETRTRFVEERNQWNAERDQLKAAATEVCLHCAAFA